MNITNNGYIGMTLSSGEQVVTNKGYITTPFPKVDFTTNRKCINTIKNVDKWLIDNAVIQAEKSNDSFILISLKQSQKSLPKISPSDKDSAEYYLFG